MDEKQIFSVHVSERDSILEIIPTEEESGKEKSENCSLERENLDDISIVIDIDSEDIPQVPQCSQQDDIQAKDTIESLHSTIDLLTFNADHEIIKELQKKAQPNVNYFLALQSLINSNKFSSESLQLKRQSFIIENTKSDIEKYEKRLLKKNTTIPSDLTFRQRINAYCAAVPIEIEWGNSPFQDKYTRHAFIRKVFAILFVCLLFTVVSILIFGFIPPVRMYFRENLVVSMVLLFVLLGFSIIIMSILSCFPLLARSYPANLMLLGLYVIIYSIVCGVLSALYSQKNVLMAAGLTVLIVGVISLFAIQTKWDMTSCGMVIFIVTLAFFFASFLFLIIYLITGLAVLFIIYCGIGVAIFSLYLMLDIQLIMGGRKYQISEEDYMPAVLLLYIDIIGIFINLLGAIEGAG